METLENLVASHPGRLVAVGEVGLDYVFAITPDSRKRQKEFLELLLERLDRSSSLKRLPLVLHIREEDREANSPVWPASPYSRSNFGQHAGKDCLAILGNSRQPRNIYRHCFSGSRQEAEAYLERLVTVWFGVSPTVLRNSDACIRGVEVFGRDGLGIEHILCETDCPVLNLFSTLDVRYVYEWVRLAKGMSLNHVQAVMKDNFRVLFGRQ
jgi:TatD DNase family protein